MVKVMLEPYTHMCLDPDCPAQRHYRVSPDGFGCLAGDHNYGDEGCRWPANTVNVSALWNKETNLPRWEV